MNIQSVQKLRLISVILSVAGLADALYLTWIKFTNNYSLCIQGVGNCESVKYQQLCRNNGNPRGSAGSGNLFTHYFDLIFRNPNRPLEDKWLIVFIWYYADWGAFFGLFNIYRNCCNKKYLSILCLISNLDDSPFYHFNCPAVSRPDRN